MADTGLLAAYRERYPTLLDLAERLEAHLIDCLDGIPHIDRISTRPKDPESFLNKATEKRDEPYTDPLEEIEDQVAGRVLVFFERDIETVSDKLVDWYGPVEVSRREPERDEEFGYLSKHFIFVIPNHLKPQGWDDLTRMPPTFEIQVRTLFMHAYAEPEHELSYKSAKDLTRDQRRQFAWIAAAAWGGDQAFERLLDELDTKSG